MIGGPVEFEVGFGVGCGAVLDGVVAVVTTCDELLLGAGMLEGDEVDGVRGGPAYTQAHICWF